MVMVECSNESKTVSTAHKITQQWDFSEVRSYLAFEEKISPHEAERMETEYKRFMSVLVGEGLHNQMPISAEVDRFWHAHIMFTRDYTAFSHALAGEYIHHYPTSSKEERNELCGAYQNVTLPTLTRHFGTLDDSLWPAAAQVCIGGVSAPSYTSKK